MESNDVKQRILEILIEGLDLEISPAVIDGSDLVNEFGINSIDAVTIFVYIENTFNIVIEDESLNAEMLSSIDRITEYVVEKMK